MSGAQIDELANPMYSTCIGLILKGYNDYENNNKQFNQDYKKVEVEEEVDETVEANLSEGENTPQPRKKRAKLTSFLNSWKTNLIEMFNEEEDTKL